MTGEGIKINIASPPDRDLLTCEIMVGNDQIAELNQDDGALTFENYPRRDGKPWKIDGDLLIETLTKAKQCLLERSDPD